MANSTKAMLAIGVAAAAALAVWLVWDGAPGTASGPAPKQCLCIDADGSGGVDDVLWCADREASAEALGGCIAADALPAADAGRYERCIAARRDVRLDHAGCGGDRDGSSPGCEGGAPDGSCSAEEDERSCLADCGCFAKADLCGAFEEVGACPTDTCCCDDGCLEKGDCCPDACAACGVCP